MTDNNNYIETEEINYIELDNKGAALPIVSSYKESEYSISEEDFSKIVLLNATRFPSKDGNKTYVINLDNVRTMENGCVCFYNGMGLAGVEIDQSIALSFDRHTSDLFFRMSLNGNSEWPCQSYDFESRSAFSF